MEGTTKIETLETVVADIRNLEAKYREVEYSYIDEVVDPLGTLEDAKLVRDILRRTPETVERMRAVEPETFIQ
tara:strand:- start:397 stop:615 length:219 start_codon:yes stop_codon:yes gene_type:complete